MIQGLYAAANGMMAVEDRQAVIANNIANAMTPGFKRQIVVQTGFYQLFFDKGQSKVAFDLDSAPGGGLKITETFSDYGNGIVSTTGNPLDIALIGPAFMAVDTPQGELFTRNGKLSVGQQGQLVTNEGFDILSVDGNQIDVSRGRVVIDGEGNVNSAGEFVGRIRLIEFQDPHVLNRAGFTLYSASPEAIDQASPPDNTVVAAGAVEMSNVQLPTEVTQMMLALRAYAANQRVITAIDETASRLIDQVGAPF